MMRSAVSKRHLSFRSIGRQSFASVPPNNVTTNSKTIATDKPKLSSTSQKSGSGTGLLLSTTVALFAVGGLCYQMESDPAFEKSAFQYAPFLSHLDPVRTLMKSVGIVKSPKQEVHLDIPKSLDQKESETVITQETIPDEPAEKPVEISQQTLAEFVEFIDDVMTTESQGESAFCSLPTVIEEGESKPSTQAIEHGKQPDSSHTEFSATESNAVSTPTQTSSSHIEHIATPTAGAEGEISKASGVSVVDKEVKPLLAVVSSELRAQQVHGDASARASEELTNQSISMRRELEQTILRDMNELDEKGLRVRLTQLATEFFERTKWEGVRLHQALKQVEADVSRKYSDLMAQQRSELEMELSKVLSAKNQEHLDEATKISQQAATKHEAQLVTALHAQSEAFSSTLNKALESQATKIQGELNDELNHQVAVMREAHVKEMMSVQARIEELKAQVQAFNGIIDESVNLKQATIAANKKAAALLALESALTSSKAVQKEVQAVQESCSDEKLIMTLVQGLPAAVATSGAPTLSELRCRFDVVRQEARKAALAPQGLSPLIGQLVGNALAAISWAPTGNVPGSGVEEALARAEYDLERGMLPEAVKEVDQLQGYARVLCSDWLALANQRLVADQTVLTLRAQSIIRYKTLA